jgi:TonB family protein
MVSPVVASDRARRAAPWIRRGGGAVLMSAAVHAAAAVTIGGVLAFAPASPGATIEPATVDVTVMALADRPLPQSAPSPAAPAAPAPAHASVAAHRRLVAHAVPAIPPPTVAPTAPPIAAPPADEPRLMFALSAGTVASGPALAASPIASPGLTTRSSTSAPGAGSADAAAVGEREVDVPARLLAAATLAYPPAARQAEIETDFPLEIVVDAGGRVVSARAVSHAGYGLDEAALQGIRGYRFSPAMRAGRPVAVRMRWVVQFRLR